MDNYKIHRQNPAAGGNSNKLVVFLHGYGADGKDLIDLANPFGMALPNAALFPLMLLIHVQCLLRKAMVPNEEIPKGAIKASLGLLDLIEDEAKLNLTFKDVILIGFSQGAMMSMQCLLINHEQLGAIIGYSGALREENIDAANDRF